MGQKTGFPPPYLVTSTPDRALSARQDAIARKAIERIEQSRAELIGCGHLEAVQLLDIALVQLALSLNGVSHDELVFLTDEPENRPGRTADCEDSA